MKKKVLVAIILSVIFYSCNPGPTSQIISSVQYPYQAFVSLQMRTDSLKRCQQFQEKVVNFYFHHEQIEKLKGLEMIIEIGGVFYQKAFNEHIILTDFRYCNDNSLSKIGSINIHVADSIKGIVYLWSKISSFDLADLRTVHMKLLAQDQNADNYMIKINNDIFYK